jgi:hypothetical protein
VCDNEEYVLSRRSELTKLEGRWTFLCIDKILLAY